MAAYNAREFHHIYPKAFLNVQGIGFHESNVIANVCLLTSKDNKEISDKNPADYFSSMPATEKDKIFDSACIPVEARDGSKLYADFLSLRTQALVAKATHLIKNGSL